MMKCEVEELLIKPSRNLMRYKIKNKVRVKSKEWYNAQPKDDDGNINSRFISFDKDMVDLCDQVGVIIGVFPPDKLYRIYFKGEGSRWFCEDWIEPKKCKNKFSFNFNLYKSFKFDKYI